MPALLRAKITASDDMSIAKTPGLQTGFMVLSEFENEVGLRTSKIFPNESSALSYAQGQQVIKVDVIRKF